MNKKEILFRILTAIAAIISATLLFFNWFTISLPALNTFIKSSDMSLSFMNLPGFMQENVIGLITRMGGKSTSATLLILCGILKYACLVSAILGLYGIWKVCVRKRRSRFIFSSQVIAIAMEGFSFLLIIVVNIVIHKYAAIFASAMKVQESLIDISFMPTLWLILATVFSVSALICSNVYNKMID